MQPSAARNTPPLEPSEVSAGARCLRSWRPMNATPSRPATRCASATPFTWCTPFRRSRRKVSPRLRKKSNSSNNGSPRQNGTIERGTTEMKKNHTIRVKEGSGNVFADLGFPNPEREQLKARLTLQIYRLIKDRGLTQ